MFDHVAKKECTLHKLRFSNSAWGVETVFASLEYLFPDNQEIWSDNVSRRKIDIKQQIF